MRRFALHGWTFTGYDSEGLACFNFSSEKTVTSRITLIKPDGFKVKVGCKYTLYYDYNARCGGDAILIELFDFGEIK